MFSVYEQIILTAILNGLKNSQETNLCLGLCGYVQRCLAEAGAPTLSVSGTICCAWVLH